MVVHMLEQNYIILFLALVAFWVGEDSFFN